MLAYRRTFGLLFPFLLVACAIAALSGCGSGGDTAAADRPLTKAEFIKEVDVICRKGIAAKERGTGGHLGPGKTFKNASQAEIKRFVEVVAIEPFSKIVAQLSQLHPPNGDKAAVRIVRAYEKALKEGEADPLGAMKYNPFLKADKVAEAYGIKSCLL